MKYKLIAVDFDGTLLTDKKEVSSYTKSVLAYYRNNGYIIVGVTARALNSVKSVLDINMFDYLILNNGSYTYDVKNNSGRYESTISKEIYTNITDYVNVFSTKVDYCTPFSYYSYKDKNQSNISFIKSISSLDEIIEDVVRMNVFTLNYNDIEDYCSLINNKYDQVNCFVMRDSDNLLKWLVINPKGIDKAITLKKLGSNLNIDLQDMIFFGDGPNDLEVINLVGCGVAMGNALEEVKEIANNITLSNNEDGVAVFLNNLLK